MTDARAALSRLFRATGEAHHKAFAATNGDDPHWPEWYARYLALPLSELLGTEIAPDVLGFALRAVEHEMRVSAPQPDWTLYYADWFLARYSVLPGAEGPPIVV